jgi:PAS domain S-box-containing protein
MESKAAAPIRVLYAEDDAADADLTTAYFQANEPDFALDVVQTGAACIEALEQGRYDLLLLDHHLPDMDAPHVLQRLAAITRRVPVVVTTSVGDETLAVQVFRLGVSDYVPKAGDYLMRLPAVLRGALADAGTGSEQRAAQRRILYVEHDAADVDLTLTHLAEVAPHFRVETADSASAALARLRESEFDLVLADLRLPEMNALELLRQTKDHGLDVPFVVVTGGGDEITAIAALKLGAYDYIVKRDGYLTRLPYAIDHAIARRQLAQANRDLQRELRERQRLQRMTDQTLALLDSLQQHAPIGIALVDCECRFQRVNDELAAIDGLSSADHVDRALIDVLPGLAGQLEPLCRQASEGVALSNVEVTGTTQARPGEQRYFNVSVYPVRGGDQELVGVGLAVTEITERKRAEAALREHATMMADVARQKDEFLAMLGHELRNPLAPIRTALELLRRAGAPDQVSRSAHEVIGRQVTHMVHLVDDLLDVARITRGRVNLSMEVVDINRVVADAVDTVRPLITARRHLLETSVPPGTLLVHGDVTRLVQVLVNLLNNAAKYTSEAGTIRLSVTAEDGYAVVRVADTGHGIPARLLPKIFDLFTQDERELDRAQGGLGVGLTLVKRIAELHGGSVEAHSGGRGLGSIFTVRLPLHTRQDAPRLERAPRASDHHRPLRCLVVEDNIDAARMLEIALTLEGHEVRLAFDGSDAVETAAQFRPDAVVLDIGLPRLNGYDAARAIRRIPDLAGVFIVAVTGYGQVADYEHGVEAGFDAHLVKPIDIDTLLNALDAGRRGTGSPPAS